MRQNRIKQGKAGKASEHCRNPTIRFVYKVWSAKAHEAKNVLRCETYFHKSRRMQGMKPNDFQVHSHFRNYTHAKVVNVQNSLNFSFLSFFFNTFASSSCFHLCSLLYVSFSFATLCNFSIVLFVLMFLRTPKFWKNT